MATGVYPRGCGGASRSHGDLLLRSGLSPRVRGSRAACPVPRGRGGSIPAGAGEPATPSRASARCWVYPRGCGGAGYESMRQRRLQGLSPRVRGSRHVQRLALIRRGSIPAGAGEPTTDSRNSDRHRVYPRGCGGAVHRGCVPPSALGLSPRVRGSLALRRRPAKGHGSIPAGAGEPDGNRCCPPGSRVYPRGCGGAPVGLLWQRAATGLSPRVRGSLFSIAAAMDRTGSIPAGAGEPCPSDRRWRRGRVYPRGCGGARPAAAQPQPGTGLSPRVRGSQHSTRSSVPGWGSIPAGAGEPGNSRSWGHDAWVYPRGCGGADCDAFITLDRKGLSPRVRGSPFGSCS